jgi:hypothetical protein
MECEIAFPVAGKVRWGSGSLRLLPMVGSHQLRQKERSEAEQ